MMPVLKKSERTPRLGTIKGGMEAVMVRATTGRRAGSRKGCKLLFKSSRNLIYHAFLALLPLLQVIVQIIEELREGIQKKIDIFRKKS